MNRIVIIILTVVCLLTGNHSFAPAFAATSTSPVALDIGIATPLTGHTADLGNSIKNAVLLAIKDQNDQGGVTIAGQNYFLNSIVLDTKSDAGVGKTVVEQLIYSKKVKVIFGPAVKDAIAAQSVTEANKVIGIFLQVIIPAMAAADKPYTFYTGGPLLQYYNMVTAYIPQFHPEAKTVLTIIPDAIDAPAFLNPARIMCERYGLNWLGAEKFPLGTRDFSPIITRALSHKPDIIDTANIGGSMGPLVADLIRQLREAGFKGLILVPTSPSLSAIQQIVPPQHRTGIVIYEINPESPMIPDSYRAMGRRYSALFNKPADHAAIVRTYNVAKAFFEFLDGQEKMDTTVWMKGFAEYRWKAIWGQESFFVGKPIWGSNRNALSYSWVSEYINGKLETKWEVPIPMEMYYAP